MTAEQPSAHRSLPSVPRVGLHDLDQKSLLRRGPPVADQAIFVDEPVIVVEVVSPSSRGIDTGMKLEGCFRLATVRHYLILQTDSRVVIHHARAEDDTIRTTIRSGGFVRLDPPGIEFDAATLFS